MKVCWKCGAPQTKPTKRSNLQNRAFHGDHQLLANASGHTLQEVKDATKQMMPDIFKPQIKEVIGFKVKVFRSSADLTKYEMTEVIDRYRKFYSKIFPKMQWYQEVQ